MAGRSPKDPDREEAVSASLAHAPVLVSETLRLLNLRPGAGVVDATLGSGGHAREILKVIGPDGRLVGIDQDPEAVERAKKSLEGFPQVCTVRENFSGLHEILERLNFREVDAVILDVGVSSEQLEEARRGFSFLKDGPLDMRMDPGRPVTARDLVNDLSQEELERIFRKYGEERWAKRIAGAICRERFQKPIETTAQLVQLVRKAVPRPLSYGPRHPAMRVFQALRIAVNQELQSLERVLPPALTALRSGGRLAVITFHSLEDRIVKRTFREWKDQGKVMILTPKPVTPTPEEVQRNPRARSAKLRGVEKLVSGRSDEGTRKSSL